MGVQENVNRERGRGGLAVMDVSGVERQYSVDGWSVERTLTVMSACSCRLKKKERMTSAEDVLR